MTTKVKKTAYSKKIQPAVKKKMKNEGPRCRAKGGVYDNQSGSCVITKGKKTSKKSKAQQLLSISL
jgi:hypothetical protein